MVLRANGQKAQRLATSRENPQTDEERDWGIPASQPQKVPFVCNELQLRVISLSLELALSFRVSFSTS